MPRASDSVFDHLGQFLEEAPEAAATLRRWLTDTPPTTRALALRYYLHAHRTGHPTPPLTGASFAGCDLTGASFTNADTTALRIKGGSHLAPNLVEVASAHTPARLPDLDMFVNTMDGPRILAMHPQADTCAIGNFVGNVYLWDARNAQCLHHHAGHTQEITDLAFSSTGDLLASAGDDRTARIWDTTNGECLHVLSGFDRRIASLAFHPSRPIVATSSDDGTLRF